MVDVFTKRQFELLNFTETRLRRNEEISRHGVNSISVSFQEIERTRKGAAVYWDDVWQCCN